MGKMTLMSDNKGKNIIEIIALIIGLGVVVYLVLDMMKPKKVEEPAPQPQNNTVAETGYDDIDELNKSQYLKQQSDGTYKAELTLDNYLDAFDEFHEMTTKWQNLKMKKEGNFKGYQLEYSVNAKINNNDVKVSLKQKEDNLLLYINDEEIRSKGDAFWESVYLHVLDNRYLLVSVVSSVAIADGSTLYIYDPVTKKVIYETTHNGIMTGLFEYKQVGNKSSYVPKYGTNITIDKLEIVKDIVVDPDGSEHDGFMVSCDEPNGKTNVRITIKLHYSDNYEIVATEDRKVGATCQA